MTEVSDTVQDAAFARALAAFDPEAPGLEVLQAGRNLTVKARIGGVAAVVKRFPSRSPLRAALDRAAGKAPKATRSMRIASELRRRVPGATPAPLGATQLPDGRGLFATAFEPGLVSMTRALATLYAGNGPCEELMALLDRVARACRAWHDAGFWHGDLGNQNVQLAPDGRVLTLDLDRARLFDGPGGVPLRLRARDLSRIALPSDFLRVFFEMYWRDVPPREFLRAESRFRRAFALHTATRKWRHPFRKRAPAAEPVYPPPPDIWIWDRKSEQAVSTMRSRDRRRWQSTSRLWRPLAALARGAVRTRRAALALARAEFAEPVRDVASRFFVSVSADPERWDREKALLGELDPGGVHVRLYFHESAETTAFKLRAVAELAQEGRAVAASLVQSRAAVLRPEAWRAFCERAAAALPRGGAVRFVEFLHAPNRVKWGVWTYAELRALLAPLPALKATRPDLRFAAPPVIDFEWDWFAGALPLVPEACRPGVSDAPLALELYLDRRGAPENPQGRWDGVAKLRRFRALAAGPGGVPDAIVTEFNWPLAGTGEWSPVGSPYVSPGVRTGDPSVGEDDAARFAVRWMLLGICSGHASAMSFWSLAAHGFGLVDPGTEAAAPWRRRPAFGALRQLFAFLRGCDFESAPLRGGASGVWLLRFAAPGGSRRAVAWKAGGGEAPAPAREALGFEPARASGIAGAPVVADGPLCGDPVYYQER